MMTKFEWKAFLPWLIVTAVAIIITISAVNSLKASNAASSNKITGVGFSNHLVQCVQLANLSHTPTHAEMRYAGCDPRLLDRNNIPPPPVQVP